MRTALLAHQMQDAYQMLRDRLEGMSEDEYFWEPVADCWTVYQAPDGRWTYHYELSDDEQLDAERLTNWGERWPTWRIFWTMVHHDAHHGAEIGCIRDLYLRQGTTADG